MLLFKFKNLLVNTEYHKFDWIKSIIVCKDTNTYAPLKSKKKKNVLVQSACSPNEENVENWEVVFSCTKAVNFCLFLQYIYFIK